MARPSIEDEVLGNVRRMPLGPPDRPVGTVSDLNLPLDFLRRVADRVIQASFRERWRVVLNGTNESNGGVEHVSPPVPEASGPVPSWVTVLPVRPTPEPPCEGGEWVECRPALRGFRAPILGGMAWPFSFPESGPLAAAAKIVNAKLATHGLAKICAQVAEMLGDGQGSADEGETPPCAGKSPLPTSKQRLQAVGLPVDLVDSERQAHNEFAARPENSLSRVATMRAQLTGPGYYAGRGDGGSLDILRQLVESIDGVHWLVSVHHAHLEGVLANVRNWVPRPRVSMALIPESQPVAQWARDNAIAGVRVGRDPSGPNGGPSPVEPALLAPRWAGRGEEGGIFIPGETFLMEGLRGAGMTVQQSPLLFEGGNLLVVEDGERRVLLLGEAEVGRNTAMGLTREQVLELFRSELRADMCVVLPAASFHIDLEVTVGVGMEGGKPRPVAFVLDTLPAVREVCRLAANTLADAGRMPRDKAAICANASAPLGAIVTSFDEVLRRAELSPGRYNLEFAKLFRSGEVDSGVGNFKRVLFAFDWLVAEMGVDSARDSHHGAFLRSLRRQEKDRGAIARHLKNLGWRTVKVPGLSSESVSLNPVNGLWIHGRYYMSGYGGYFRELDEAAARVFRAEGFDVNVVLTGETQRRGGGLHCAIGVG